MPMFKRGCVVLLVMLASACGGGSSTTAPTPTPTTVALTGFVNELSGGDRVAGVTIQVLDGPNAGRSTTTNSNGAYAFAGLTSGNANLSANATGYAEEVLGVFINGSNTLNFGLTARTP
jgi:hypothetical protein